MIKGSLQINGNPFVPPTGQFGVEDAVSQISAPINVGLDGKFTYSTKHSLDTACIYLMQFILVTSSGNSR